MRAALHIHGLETGAAALGVLNYASKATEIGVQSGSLRTSTGRQAGIYFRPGGHLH